MRAGLCILLLALASACSSEPTEVVLVVDGEFATPSEIDRLDVTVTAPTVGSTTPTVTASAVFDATSPGFPRTLGILPSGGGAGEYIVDVAGKLGSTTVVRNRARFRFTANQIRMVRVDLLRVCAGVSCPSSSRTCGEGGICVPIDVLTEPWSGQPVARFDAGTSTLPLVVVP